MGDQNHPDTVVALVAMLVEALSDLGLSAEGFGGSMVWVVNRVADPGGDDLRVAPTSPGLRQVVQCRLDDLGHWGWWWVWTAPGEMPTYEWFAPATDVDEATERIARVLALRPEAVS
jgi:hypothetical protein